MKSGGYFGDAMRSVAFLSRIPVPPRFFAGEVPPLSVQVRAFPLAGALILLAPALCLWLALSLQAAPLLAAFLTLTLQALLTGALHEDGLSDAADGLFGGHTKADVLAIMKDSRLGSYGGVALVLSFGLRAAAIAALAERLDPLAAALCLPAVAALSRALMVWHWSALPPAKDDGLAASQGVPEKNALRTALVAGLLIALALILPFAGPAAMILTLALATLATAAFTAFVRGRTGGHTGDTIGATQQIGEALSLASLALVA